VRRREVHGVLGVDKKLSRAVAENLRNVGIEGNRVGANGRNGDIKEGVILRWTKDVGLMMFLLKFGEGLEDISLCYYVSIFTIGMGYLLGSLIPLLPCFLIPCAHITLLYLCIMTGIILIFGVVKAWITGAAGKG